MKLNFITLFLFFVFLNATAQENQNIELLKLTSGSIAVSKVVEGGSNFKFESTSKTWPVNFTKSGDRFTEIIINRSGIIEEKYEADLPNYPAYYKSSSSEIVITAIDKKIYYYSWSVKTGASIKYILSDSKIKNYNDEKNTIDTYRNTIKDLQAAARNQRIEENTALAEKLAEENTLKGKKIKKIKIIPVSPPTEIGLLSILSLGFEVELEDGKLLKTINLGGLTPYTDFEAQVSGGDFAGGDLKVADDSRKIPNDKIEIFAWSKFDEKKIKGQYSVTANYKKDINYNYSGNSGGNGRGYTVGYNINGSNGANGKSVNIEVTSMTVNGEKINKLTVIDAMSGKIFSESKMHIDNTLNINTAGGNGGNGSVESGNGGSGGNGGNGGTIKISGTGSSSLKTVVTNTGGRGGVGSKGKTQSFNNGSNGSAGQNGTLIK